MFLSGHRRRLFRHKVAARRLLLMSPLLRALSRRVIVVFGCYAKRRHAACLGGHEADVRLLGLRLNGSCVSLIVFVKPGGTPTRGTGRYAFG